MTTFARGLFYTDDFSLTPIILSEAQKAGFEPNIVCKSSQWDFIVKMVEANMGIAILPEIYCRKFSNLKKIYFNSEPYRVCRRVNILRDYPDDKIKIYP
ncbi:LysR substrate-binding domain-containing protein [Acinetobacter sp. YH12156]|uniref:LysR substrate-binding domain-containing protein n=1 Tax=unclassified Acinetobacter TaxID=196816 RepID=UPI0035A10A36